MPLAMQVMKRKPSAPHRSEIDRIPHSALQGRFPRRDTHVSSFHMKKKLEANSSLLAFTDAGSDARAQNKDSNAFLRTMDYGLCSDTPNRVSQVVRRRPVTGKVRLTRNNQAVMYSNLPSQSGEASLKPLLMKHMDIRGDLEKFHYTQVLADGNISSWPKTTTTLTTINYEHDQPQDGQKSIKNEQLPENVLAFMEQNDLPVYIDNKQHRSTKYKNSVP